MNARIFSKDFTPMVISIAFLLVMEIFGINGQGSCPTQKRSRKMLTQRLRNLAPQHVIIEAIYIEKQDGAHRFQVEQVWDKNNGGLEQQMNFIVEAAQLDNCFSNLEQNDKVILAMTQLDVEGREYRAVESPVLSKKKKYSVPVCVQLSFVGHENDCYIKASLSSGTIFYRGSDTLLLCKVESSSKVVDVQWYKNGQNMNTSVYKELGLKIHFRNKDNSFVLLENVNTIHKGQYKCVARNADGRRATASKNVKVLGPNPDMLFTACENPSHCMNGGKCRQIVDDDEMMCECLSGFVGERCEYTSDDITASSTKAEDDMEEMRDELSRLTTAVVVVTIALLCVILFSIMYINRLRKRLSPNKDIYDVVNPCCTDSERSQGDIETTRYANGGIEATGIRISIDETESRTSLHPNMANTKARKSPSNSTVFMGSTEQFARPSPNGSMKNFEAKSPKVNSLSRHSSTTSDRLPRRGRLSAKSLN